MTEGYWAWLTKNLKIAWGWIKIIPFALWDLAKWIRNDLRKTTLFSLIKEIISDTFSWSNICAGTGSICLMGLIFGVVVILSPEGKSFPMFWWGIGEVVLFLVSTYAYWRDEQ